MSECDAILYGLKKIERKLNTKELSKESQMEILDITRLLIESRTLESLIIKPSKKEKSE